MMEKVKWDYVKDLVKWEGSIPWMYCDVRGLVTVGIGNLVYEEQVTLYPFKVGKGVDATPEQKIEAFHVVRAAFVPDEPPPANFYKKLSDLRLPAAVIAELVETRVNRDFIPGIVKVCPRFDVFPGPVRSVLLDIAYNCGVGGFYKFRNLIAACNAGQWRAAAGHCHRSTSREERNEWARDLLLSVAQ